MDSVYTSAIKAVAENKPLNIWLRELVENRMFQDKTLLECRDAYSRAEETQMYDELCVLQMATLSQSGEYTQN